MFNWKKQTVHNAIIQLGDTDDSGKGRHFKSRFMKDGLVKVEKFGKVLIKKENLDKFIDTMVGVPVIINHKDITEDNADDERVGVVNSVWYNNEDGWFWCDGVIWDKTAQNLITDKGWSVSCSYDVKLANDEGGSENNIKYDIEFLDAVFTHLALVNNPRYERANIVFNSKTVIENGGQGSGHHQHAGIKGYRGGSLPRGMNSDFIQELEQLIKTSTEDKLSNEEVVITEVTPEAFKAAQKQGVDLTGYVHTIDSKAIRHRNNGHLKDESDDITDDDLKKIPEIIYKPDNAQYYKRKHLDHINYEKTMPDGTYFYIEEVRTGKKTLTTKTIYKKVGAPNVENSTNEVTSKTPSDTNIINCFSEISTPNSENVKEYNNMEINNGWITKYDDDGNPYHVNIEGYNEESDKKENKAEKKEDSKDDKKYPNRHAEILYKDLPELRDKLHKAKYERAKAKESGADVSLYDKKIKEYEDKEQKLKDEMQDLRDSRRKDKDRYTSLIEESKQEDKSDKKEDKKESKVADTKILAGGVKESKDEHGRTIFSKKDSNKKVKIHKNGNYYLASYGQELKDDDGYTEFQVFPSASGKSFKTEEGARKWALKQLNVNNSKEQTMEIIEKLKALIFSVENGKDYTMVNNEKVDKRKLIDEVAGIMKSAGCDDEVIRTAIGKMEKIGYDKSEADTADNKKEDKKDDKVDNKCDVKNEDAEDEKEVKEVKEEIKEDVENCGKKGKVDNSKTDYFAELQKIYNSASSSIKEEPVYVSRADREQAADDYFRN